MTKFLVVSFLLAISSSSFALDVSQFELRYYGTNSDNGVVVGGALLDGNETFAMNEKVETQIESLQMPLHDIYYRSPKSRVSCTGKIAVHKSVIKIYSLVSCQADGKELLK